MISVVIPAAGSGTRMQQGLPKALTEFKNSTFLKWQLDKFKYIAKDIFVVVSAKDLSKFEDYRRIHNLDFIIIIQTGNNGSYFAIESVIDSITTEFIMICWVDQIGVSKSLILETINKLIVSKFEGILPLIFVDKPYVKARLSETGKLNGWEYRREGAEPSEGYSDLGLFAFRTKCLKKSIKTITDFSKFRSALTHEFNFLDFLPYYAGSHVLNLFYNSNIVNSTAVNTRIELEKAEMVLTEKVQEVVYSVIIPSFNEGPRLSKLLTQLNDLVIRLDSNNSFSLEIIIVDDGSTDTTSKILSDFPFKYVYQSNSGKGSAVKLGRALASGDYFIVLDADGEYLVSDLVPLINYSMLHPLNVIYGSRYLEFNSRKIKYLPLPGQSILNLYFNYLLSLIILIRFKIFITDSLTGYKIYHRDIYDTVNPVTKGFETDHELSKMIIKLGINITELRIAYRPRSRAEGKKISFIDALKALRIWLT
jgi:molybdopterin-guanine dinucleotide biosynthesis protein A